MTLYRRGASGKPLQWRIWSEGADIFIEHGQVGGKLQLSRNRAEGKNIGKCERNDAGTVRPKWRFWPMESSDGFEVQSVD